MPITVIRKRFLYLKIFLAVTLDVNDILFQIKPMCSSKIFLPIFGVLGRIRTDGVSTSSL